MADDYDSRSDALGHVPYTPLFFAALGTAIFRRIHALSSPPYKVVVLDRDQTLWKGVAAEDGPRGVEIDPGRRALQARLVEERAQGRLLCLASKNDEADVFSVFDAHPEMPLKRGDFVAWRINWQPKSENLRALANELGLGLDSFILIDDNPLDCAEVEAACPEVLRPKGASAPRGPSSSDSFRRRPSAESLKRSRRPPSPKPATRRYER